MNNVLAMQGNRTKIEFLRGVFTDIDGSPEHVRRNFSIDFGDVNSRNSIRAATSNGMSIGDTTLNGFYNNFISLAPASKSSTLAGPGRIIIPGGYGYRRCRFSLVFKETSLVSKGKVTFKILIGYTDQFEKSIQSDHIAPETRLFFNRIIEVNPSTTVTPSKPNPESNPHIDVSNFLHSHNRREVTGVSNGADSTEWVARPTDVFNQIGMAGMAEVIPNGSMSEISPSRRWAVDSSLKMGPILSSATHDNPIAYTTELIKTYNESLVNTEIAGRTVCHETAAMLRSKDETALPYLTDIPLFTQSNIVDRLRENSSITFRELELLAPGILNPNDHRLELSWQKYDNVHLAMLPPELQFRSLDSAAHTSTTWNTEVSEIISNSVPTIIQNEGLASVCFRITTDTVEPGKVAILPFATPLNLPLIGELQPYFNDFMNSAFRAIQARTVPLIRKTLGPADFDILMFVDTTAKIRMTIDVRDGYGPVPYINDCYSSSIKSPLIVPTSDHLTGIATSMNTLMDVVRSTSDSDLPSSIAGVGKPLQQQRFNGGHNVNTGFSPINFNNSSV